MSAGVETLLRGKNPAPAPTDPATIKPTDAYAEEIFWSLLVADVVICGLVSMLLISAPKPLGIARIITGFFALAFGAWLSCLALWLSAQAKR